jgi:N-methylhydantoinase B
MPNQTRLGLTTSGTPLGNGDLLRIVTPGGGGYGDPSEREPEALKRDLIEGKVSHRAAREFYAVTRP